jgi:hypothetical protein
VLRVIGYDGQGNEMVRSIISGQGYGELDGDCDAGARALETAVNQAIKQTMESYVSRVINGGQLI